MTDSGQNATDINEQLRDSFRKFLEISGLDTTMAEDLDKRDVDLADDEVRAKLLFAAFQGVIENIGLIGVKPEELLELRTTLTSESDRGCALMAAAYLDSQLEKLLRAFFVDDDNVMNNLFNNNGPLGTFSARIDLSYGVGLISKSIRRDLHLLRKIRNEFAHVHLKLSFNDDAISSRCYELENHGLPDKWDPRHKFIRTMMGIAAHLHFGIMTISHAKSPVSTGKEIREQVNKEIMETISEVRSE